MISITRTALTLTLSTFLLASVASAEMPVTPMPAYSGNSSPEIGHVPWDWWRHIPTNMSMPAPHKVRMMSRDINPEIGHIKWDWWRKSGHAHR